MDMEALAAQARALRTHAEIYRSLASGDLAEACLTGAAQADRLAAERLGHYRTATAEALAAITGLRDGVLRRINRYAGPSDAILLRRVDGQARALERSLATLAAGQN